MGVHYIGEAADGYLIRTIIDQISDGQIEWKEMEKDYDVGK